MAFNFGAFVGGLSRQIVEDIEADEAYDQQLGFFKEKQDILSGKEIEKERKLKELELESNIKALKFAGFDDQRAASIAMSGAYAVERSLGVSEYIAENYGDKYDVNTLFKIADNSTENMDALETEVKNTTDQSKKISTGVLGMDTELMTEIYAQPAEVDGSYGAAISRVSQEQADLDPNSSEWAVLEEKRQQYLKDLTDFKQAELKKDGTITPTFDVNTIEPVVNSVQRRNMGKLKIAVDFQTKLVKRMSGDEGRYGVALLATAYELESSYGGLQDALMKDKITYKMQEAKEELRQYALNQTNIYTKNPKNVTAVKVATDRKTVGDNIANGVYKAGDVIHYTDDNGNLQIMVYTGIQGSDIVIGIN